MFPRHSFADVFFWRRQIYLMPLQIFLVVAAILTLAAQAWAEPDIIIQNKTYNSGVIATEWSEFTIETQGSVTVQAGANATFTTGDAILLEPGFVVEAGAVFSAKIQATPYYNPGGYYTVSPLLSVISGGNQFGSVNSFNLQPFDLVIWNAAGTAPLVNAPVMITVDSGGGWLSSTNGAGAILTKTLEVMTDADGTVQAYYKHGSVALTQSNIKVIAGGSYAQLVTTTYIPVPSAMRSVSAGLNHSLALIEDGTVWAWGRNQNGQLGHGHLGEFWYPAKVESLAGIRMISAGADHSLALKSDGTIWAWGSNYYGQLGDGTNDQKTSPVMVSGLSGIVAISAGNGFSLALKTDGTVWAWGQNYDNQLGDGTTTGKMIPVQVSGLSGVIAIDSGYYHSAALKSDGTVWVWGLNHVGQLGTNYAPDRSSIPNRHLRRSSRPYGCS